MAKQATLAGFEPPPRAKPRVMAKVVDAGENIAQFECAKCGWNSGWVYDDEMTVTQTKRGIPCEPCNTKEPRP
jgi:DNA-directed RNA polymerase subunit RPC12/RpoP